MDIELIERGWLKFSLYLLVGARWYEDGEKIFNKDYIDRLYNIIKYCQQPNLIMYYIDCIIDFIDYALCTT